MGLSPRPVCRYRPRTKKNEVIVAYSVTFTNSPRRKSRERNRPRSTRGCRQARTRCSHHANAAPDTGTAARKSQHQSGQPRAPPSTIGMVSSPAARVSRATPARSRLGRVGDRDSGTVRKPNRNVRAGAGGGGGGGGGRRSRGRGPKAEQERGGGQGDVDEEDRPPAQAADVGRQEDPAERLPADLSRGDGHPVDAEGDAAFPRREAHPDDREHLRDHHRRRRALNEPGDDQDVARRREPARGGGQRERRHAGEEDATAPVPVAEPPAGHEAEREREAVAPDNQLKGRGTAAKLPVQRGSGDVDREEVEHVHEHARQDSGGAQPRAATGP